MAQDLQVARPFSIIGSDGKRYAYGIGYYPGVSDEVAALPFVQWHLQESSVRSRGGWIAQQRLGVGGGRVPMMIWLNGGQFGTDILAGPWPPAYQDGPEVQFFQRLDHASPDVLMVGVDAIGGKFQIDPDTWVRRHQPLPPLLDVVRVYPGDPSPPIRTAGDPLHRDRATTSQFVMQQRAIAQAQAAQAAAMAVPPASIQAPRTPPTQAGGPRDPLRPKWDQQQYFFRDPRQAMPVTPPPVQQQAPSVTLRLVPDYDIANERTRAKLDRRPPQAWARAA